VNFKSVFSRLQAVVEFTNLQHKLGPVEGFLLDPEAYALMLLAAEGSGTGEIVEIGSFMGLSTCWLAVGSAKAGRETVHAIDHFKGSPEHQPGGGAACETVAEDGSTFAKFRENVRTAGVEDRVHAIVASSAEAAKGWDKPIRLLFIDGEHSYEAVKADFELWSPFVVEGGIIAFHDVGNAEGATRFYEEFLKNTSDYRQMMRVASLAIVLKLTGASNPAETEWGA